jgi:hypothetical protein
MPRRIVNICISNCAVLYILLVIIDMTLGATLRKAERQVLARTDNVDRPLKSVAYKNGYVPLLSPNLRRQLTTRTISSMPLGGVPESETVFCNEDSGLVTYSSDKYGFRGAVGGVNMEHMVPRVLIVGDSYAQGACIQDEPYLSALRGHSIINSAMEGNDFSDYYRAVKYFGKGPISRIIVFIYAGNDLQETFAEYAKRKNIPAFLGTWDCQNNYSQCANSDRAADMRLAKSITSQHILHYGNAYVHLYTRIKDLLVLRRLRSRLTIVKNNLVDMKSRNHARSQNEIYTGASQMEGNAQKQMIVSDFLGFLNHACKTPSCIARVVIIPNSGYWEPNNKAVPVLYSLIEKSIKDEQLEIRVSLCGKSIKPYDYAKNGYHLTPIAYNKVMKCALSEST